MSSWTFTLSNTTCSSTLLQLSKVEQNETGEGSIETISSIPTSAKVVIADIEYNFTLSGDHSSSEGEISVSEAISSATDISQTLNFEPALTLQDSTYTLSLILQFNSEQISKTTEITLKDCIDSAQSKGSEEESLISNGGDMTESTEGSSQESAHENLTQTENASQSLTEYTELVTPTWSVEDALGAINIPFSTATAMPEISKAPIRENEYTDDDFQEKKSIESGATTGGLFFLLLIVCLLGALYYRRQMQKKRRQHSALMQNVCESDMQNA